MSLKPVRTYFKTRLSATDSTFKEHKEGFSDRDDIPNTVFDKSFFISVDGVNSVSHANGVTEDRVPVRVDIFFKGYRTVQSNLDTAVDLVNDFRLRAVNPVNANDTIKGCEFDGMEIDHLSNNDSNFIITARFTVTAFFAVI